MHVLIIDEEPHIRHVLVCTVEPEHVAVAVGSWHEALTQLQQQQFDAVVLDMRLMDGSELDVISLLAKGQYGCRVVAYSTTSDRENALRRGAFEYLQQPFTPVELRDVLARIPERPECKTDRVVKA